MTPENMSSFILCRKNPAMFMICIGQMSKFFHLVSLKQQLGLACFQKHAELDFKGHLQQVPGRSEYKSLLNLSLSTPYNLFSCCESSPLFSAWGSKLTDSALLQHRSPWVLS